MTHSYIWHYLHIVSKEAKRKQVISKITIMTLDRNNVNIEVVMQIHRSNRRRCSVRKGVLRNFTKFTRKHLCQSLFLLKKRFWHRCFPKNFMKFLRTPFLQNTSRRLLLNSEEFHNIRFFHKYQFEYPIIFGGRLFTVYLKIML